MTNFYKTNKHIYDLDCNASHQQQGDLADSNVASQLEG